MKNSRKQLIKARLAKVRTGLDQILDRLTPDLMEWAPAEGMRTVAGQLVEIMACEIPLVPRLKDGTDVSDDETNRMIGDSTSLDNLRRALIDTRQVTLGYLDSLSDGE